jgi:hypothetical protein
MNKVLETFLREQLQEGQELDAASDILTLEPLPGDPPVAYIAHFRAGCLVRGNDGRFRAREGFHVGIHFPPEYLRRAHSFETLALLDPLSAWHPNIRPPLLCIGRVTPGTGLVELIYRAYELVTWQRYMPREEDALNHAACSWAREHAREVPVDPRPLKRAAGAGGAHAGD